MNFHHRSSLIEAPPNLLRTEIVVIGAGPGGSISACLLAEAGRDVLLIEEGPYLSLESCKPFSRQEMEQKYRHGGVTVTMGRPRVNYVEARCVGGGSEINSGLYHRTPLEALESWRKGWQVEALNEKDLRPHFEANERELEVSELPGGLPAPSIKMQDGANALGWKSAEVPRWFKYAMASGDQPEPPRGTRQSMTKTFIPRALAAGGKLLAETQVRSISRRGGRWLLEAVHAGRSPLKIEARTLFIACGAIQTPALLRRSGIRKNVGNALNLHATIKVVARFGEEVNRADMGVPSHQVKQFAPGMTFGCSVSTPAHLALAMIDHPEHADEVAREWRRMAIYYAMIRGGQGSVRNLPFHQDPLVRYDLGLGELEDLSKALHRLCRLLLTAGAEALYPSITGFSPLTQDSDLSRIPPLLPPDRTSLMTVHLFSTCPMGENKRVCATNSFGELHGLPGAYVADGSLLCDAPGVNPQGTIMAFARRNAMAFLGDNR